MCNCFTCSNRDLPVIKGYSLGVFGSYQEMFDILESVNLTSGGLSYPEDTPEFFWGVVMCNKDETGCYLGSEELIDVHELNSTTNKAYLLGCLESYDMFKDLYENTMKNKSKYDCVIKSINEHLDDIVRKLSIDEFQNIHFNGDINILIDKYGVERGNNAV